MRLTLFRFRNKEARVIPVFESWCVRWTSFDEGCRPQFPDVRVSAKFFISRQDAQYFVDALKDAHALLGNTTDIAIVLEES